MFHHKFGKGVAAAACAVWFILMWLPSMAFAHAELVQTSPSAGERLGAGPAYVELLFNERLDPGGMSLSVLDESSRKVAEGVPERYGEGKGIRLALPELGEGHYTVSYRVISADGHPVAGAFVFTVGNPPPLPDAGRLDPHAQVGHQHGGTQTADREILLSAARIAYYAGLLVAAGLVFWRAIGSSLPVAAATREAAISFTGKYLLIAVIVYAAMSLRELAQGEPFSEWLRILTGTSVGRLYAGALLLGLAAPLLPRLGKAFGWIWAVLFLGLESWSGHAAAFSPPAYTVGLDFVHLAAASLWAGGLVLLFAVWMKARFEAGKFARIFSRYALISFLALWATGVLSVLAFLPSPHYLLYTWWGKWLLVKTAASLLVIFVALIIRLRLRRAKKLSGFLLQADIGLLAAIIVVVGIFTYLTPLPQNEPLYYHKMGNDMHLTLRITPNAPGDNDFTVKVWLPEKDGAPKKVRLLLVPVGREDVGSIEVPIQPYTDEELDAFPDFAKYTYRAKGPYLPFAAEWKAEVVVIDARGTELRRDKTFRIY